MSLIVLEIRKKKFIWGTSQTRRDSGTDSRRNLESRGSRWERATFRGEATSEHKLAGLPAVTTESVTQETRLFLCLVCELAMRKAERTTSWGNRRG